MSEPSLTYKIEKLKEGFMGKCMINPEISVYAKTKDEVHKKMEIATKGYMKAYPDKKKIVLQSHKDVHSFKID